MLDSFYRAFIAQQRYLLYLDGLKVTILVSVIAILIGVALGTILALMRLTAEQKGKSTLLSKIAYVYIDIIRGTPTLTQLMIMYFVILKGQNGLLVGQKRDGAENLVVIFERGNFVIFVQRAAQLRHELVIRAIADAEDVHAVLFQLGAEFPIVCWEIRGDKDKVFHGNAPFGQHEDD